MFEGGKGHGRSAQEQAIPEPRPASPVESEEHQKWHVSHSIKKDARSCNTYSLVNTQLIIHYITFTVYYILAYNKVCFVLLS